MKAVWILWGNVSNDKFIVGIYAYKKTAEKSRWDCKAHYDPSAHYWIQEVNVSHDLVSQGETT